MFRNSPELVAPFVNCGTALMNRGSDNTVPYLFRDTFSTPDQVIAADLPGTPSGAEFAISDHADFDLSGGDFSACVFCNGKANNLIGQWGGGTNSWLLQNIDENVRLSLAASGGIGSKTSTGRGLVDDEWHLAYGEWDSATNTVGVAADDDSLETGAGPSGTLNNGTGNLSIGDRADNGDAEYNGRIHFAAIFDAKLTTAERTWLVNGGSGRTYAEVVAASGGGGDGENLVSKLVEWWQDTSRATGNIAGQHAGHTGVETNGPILWNYGPGESAPSSPRTADVGSWVLTQTDGQMAVSGGQLAINPQASASWGDQGAIASDGITRSLGVCLSVKINVTTWEEFGIGWHTAQADPDNYEHALQLNGTDGQIDDENGNAVVTGLSTSTDYYLAIVLRAAGAFYYQGTDLASMSLVYVQDAGSTSTLKNLLDNLDAALTVDDVKVEQLSTSLFRPIGSFSFDTGSDLEGHQSDGLGHSDGNGQQQVLTFTEDFGDEFTISGGKATLNAGDGVTGQGATCDCPQADVVIQAEMTSSTSGGVGFVLRCEASPTNGDGHWLVDVDGSVNGVHRILEGDGGYTLQASTAVSITHGVASTRKVFAYGATITAFVNDGGRVTYGSATYNQTETRVGIRGTNRAHTVDDYAIYARDGHALT